MRTRILTGEAGTRKARISLICAVLLKNFTRVPIRRQIFALLVENPREIFL